LRARNERWGLYYLKAFSIRSILDYRVPLL
jgi:hypothetical protein